MKKILIIEDEPALQRAVTQVLEEEGFTVFSSLDGESGIETTKREKPDLILLDLILPKRDGFAVLKTIKEDKETSHIPIIILSNLGNTEDIERALELGATTYLIKTNYRIEEVLEKIKSTLLV